MDFKNLISELNIVNPPESWERNYNLDSCCLDVIQLPTIEELQYYQTIYHFPDKQLDQFVQCREQIEQNLAFKRLWQLWYTVLFIAEDCHEEHYSPWPLPAHMDRAFAGLFRTLVILAHTKALLDFFKRKALPHNFLVDALEAFVHNTQESYDATGCYGLTNTKMWWLWPILRGKLFRLGRLQYEIALFPEGCNVYQNAKGQTIPLCTDNDQRFGADGYKDPAGLYHPHFEENESAVTGYGFDSAGRFNPELFVLEKSQWQLALQPGEDVLSLHIPGEGKLAGEAVLDSFEIARSFFAQYFPECHFKALVCHTWLFNTQLGDFLPPASNILGFQSLFTIMLDEADEHCLFDFIFQCPECPLEELKPVNDFQSLVLKHVRNGGILRDGFGYRLL